MYKIYTQHCTIAATAELLFPSAFNRFRLCVFRTTTTSIDYRPVKSKIFWLKFGDFYSPQETLGFLVLDCDVDEVRMESTLKSSHRV